MFLLIVFLPQSINVFKVSSPTVKSFLNVNSTFYSINSCTPPRIFSKTGQVVHDFTLNVCLNQIDTGFLSTWNGIRKCSLQLCHQEKQPYWSLYPIRNNSLHYKVPFAITEWKNAIGTEIHTNFRILLLRIFLRSLSMFECRILSSNYKFLKMHSDSTSKVVQVTKILL